MKKAILNIFMLALISVFAVSAVSCNKNSKPSGEGDAVTAFELSDDYIQLVVGESYTVDYYITPVSLQDKAVVTWESDDESIAEVDEDGCFDGFEIKELQPIIEALEKYNIDLENVSRFMDDYDLSDWGRSSVYFMAKKQSDKCGSPYDSVMVLSVCNPSHALRLLL